MNNRFHLGLSILKLSKIAQVYEFWHDFVKPKYKKKQNYVIWIQTTVE